MRDTLASRVASGEQGESCIDVGCLQLSGTVFARRTCNSFRMEQPKEPLVPQKVPNRPWSKVAVDLFTLDKTEYIILFDDYPNLFEI